MEAAVPFGRSASGMEAAVPFGRAQEGLRFQAAGDQARGGARDEGNRSGRKIASLRTVSRLGDAAMPNGSADPV